MKIKRFGQGIVAAVMAATAVSSVLPGATAYSDALSPVDTQTTVVAASSSSVSILNASGDLEAAYAEWGAVTGASDYHVYVKAS